jgi:adenine phosphoribosyltransferase
LGGKIVKREIFHKEFKVIGPAVLPVIHVKDQIQINRNIELVVECGAQGVLLINHDFGVRDFLPLIRACRRDHPSLWLGVNFLGVTGLKAFPILGDLENDGCPIDAYWADDARIDERKTDQLEAAEIAKARTMSHWSGIYFGGTAFKKQRVVDPDDYVEAAVLASKWLDVVTTSGISTGNAADVEKIRKFREGAKDTALAVASGITPENVNSYKSNIDAILVSTGINRNSDFYNIDGVKLNRLIRNCRVPLSENKGESHSCSVSEQGWYLKHMAPNIKGEAFAWLDPSAAYVNSRAFNSMLDDLATPFLSKKVDVVAGIDAAGFVLGTALAVRLGIGLLTIRKAGKLPVPTDQVNFVNYTQRQQTMELRNPAIRSGTKVLIVDQWVETGGTMNAGIELIERQGGEIAGVVAICIEEAPAGLALREKYLCSTAVKPGTSFQAQCNEKYLDFFNDFNWDIVMPDKGE